MARFEKTITLVDCARLGQELPALARPPFPGELGERIYNNISALAWSMWQQQATLLINHYGLNLADPRPTNSSWSRWRSSSSAAPGRR